MKESYVMGNRGKLGELESLRIIRSFNSNTGRNVKLSDKPDIRVIEDDKIIEGIEVTVVHLIDPKDHIRMSPLEAITIKDFEVQSKLDYEKFMLNGYNKIKNAIERKGKKWGEGNYENSKKKSIHVVITSGLQNREKEKYSWQVPYTEKELLELDKVVRQTIRENKFDLDNVYISYNLNVISAKNIIDFPMITLKIENNSPTGLYLSIPIKENELEMRSIEVVKDLNIGVRRVKARRRLKEICGECELYNKRELELVWGRLMFLLGESVDIKVPIHT